MAAPRKSFVTAKGTELPILNLKGKEYLQVAHRIQWFREDHPTGIFKTQMVEKTVDGVRTLEDGTEIKSEEGCTFRAEIYIATPQGTLMISTAHKTETKKGFPDYVEKAETGAIGRALALAGYGTQFASDDLDEGNRLADAPLSVENLSERKADAPAKPSITSVAAQEAMQAASVKPAPFKRSRPAKVASNDGI